MTDNLRQTLIAFMSANTLDESRRVLERHRELLRPQTDLLMQTLAVEQQNEWARARVETYCALLSRCREVGIAQAFAEHMRASTRSGNVPPARAQPSTMPPMQGWSETIMSARSRLGNILPGQAKPETDPSTIAMRLLMAAATGDEEELRTLLSALAHPGVTMDPHPTGGQERGVAVPPSFEDIIAVAQQLGVQLQLDPGVLRSLIPVYERILGQLRPGEHPELLPVQRQPDRGSATTGRQGRQTGIPPGIKADIAEAQRLEALRQRDPRTIGPLIQVYERMIRRLQPGEHLAFRAAVQNNLGNAYRNLQIDDQGANLIRAIECYQEALRFWTSETAPHEYASTQNNLGIAYRNLPTGDRRANLARAIECYQEALRFWTSETAPLDYAMTQHNLGNAYRDLPTGDRGANLIRAIACYQAALRIYTPATAPHKYAGTQNNLGNVYADLPTGDRGVNLARAIACYQEALRFQTPQIAPLDYAVTQHCLGAAYAILPTGDRGANLIRAIECYQQALRFRTPEATPLDYAMTQNNLGNAYYFLPTGDRGVNLVRAIACYQEALRFQTPDTTPHDYATTQNSLGNAYRDLPTGDRGANLTQAIACFQEALHFQTPEATPLDYAMTQNNLGNAYCDLPTGDREVNVARAIECYQQALRFQTPETAPRDCRQTNRNLANLHFAQGDWRAALAAYHVAMDAGERLYRAGLSAESKTVEVAENATLYRNTAFACVRLGDATEALLTLEHGKTRLLAEALRLRVPRPANVPDAIWAAFEWAGTEVRAAQSEPAAIPGDEHDPGQAYEARVQDAQAASAILDAAVEQVREYAPDFLKEIDLLAVQSILPDEHTALVAFCITDQGSMGFVVRRNHDEAVQIVEVPAFTYTDLDLLLFEPDRQGHITGGWVGDYLSRDTIRWRSTMEHVLAEVGEKLLAPILAALSPNIKRLIFLPAGRLFLLPLHAVPLPGKSPERVCDRYQISYAPSVEVLADSQAKAMRAGGYNLYAVINPEADPHRQLVFAPVEGAAIASLFAECQVHEGRAGTKEAVIGGVRERAYVHFACHGGYDWNDTRMSGLDLVDDRFTLADLQSSAVDLSATRLVTLSACETGLTDIISAEEYVGVPAGFLLAGVACVVCSLWTVLDISTALLMERFYRNHLKDGMDIAAALREAQAWVRGLGAGDVAEYTERCYQQSNRSNEAALLTYKNYYQHLAEQNPEAQPFAHPYYWAAFTVNGM